MARPDPAPRRKRRRKVKRPRPPERISSFREGYLRFLDFFETLFPPPGDIGMGEGEGAIATATNRIPILIFYVPFFYILWTLTLLVTYPFFVIGAWLDSRKDSSS